MDIRLESCFMCREITKVVCSLVTLRYMMIKQQACKMDVLLGSLMRLVAMRLKMEIILFLKLHIPSGGTSVISVSTYLQNTSSSLPLSNQL